MKPNFLIFVVDQMQSYCLGCNGHQQVRTPNIDALAADGVNFQRGYCNNTVCMPSRASMITGLTPRQHGLLTNGNCLPTDVPTVTQTLVDQGYSTYAAGKLHLQPNGAPESLESHRAWLAGTVEELPLPYYGFQEVDLVNGHGKPEHHYYRWLLEHHPEYAETPKQNIPAELHMNSWIADRTIEFIERVSSDNIQVSGFSPQPSSSPFFLWCSFPDPHAPFEACEPYRSMYEPAGVELPPHWHERAESCRFLEESRATDRFNTPIDEAVIRRNTAQTYGMISHIDDCIGRVISTLKETGQYDNTVIVFMADHGEYLGSHNLLMKDVWAYEELARVPYIWKGTAGQTKDVSQSVVSLLDFVPTILDYADVSTDDLDTRGEGRGPRLGLPGRSLRPQIQDGQPLSPEPALIEYDEDWWPAPLCRQRGLIDGDFKLIIYGGYEDEGLLFNLTDDPHEMNNLWQEPEFQTTKHELTQKLLHKLTMSDRFDTKRICGA
jgi:arylsulfatase A-like enzyme